MLFGLHTLHLLEDFEQGIIGFQTGSLSPSIPKHFQTTHAEHSQTTLKHSEVESIEEPQQAARTTICSRFQRGENWKWHSSQTIWSNEAAPLRREVSLCELKVAHRYRRATRSMA